METNLNKKERGMTSSLNQNQIKKLKKAMDILNSLIPDKSITKMTFTELKIREIAGESLRIIDSEKTFNSGIKL